MAWTKAKMAVAVAVGALLAAGTTTVVVEKAVSRFGTDHYFLNMSETFDEIPPVYCFIRPTHFNRLRSTNTDGMGSKDRAIGRNLDLEMMIEYAYNYHDMARTILPPEGFPGGGFDFLVTAPGGMEQFRAQIRTQFGYTAHKEVRATDVLVLKVNRTNAPGLKPSTGDRPNPPARPGTIKWANLTISSWSTQLEYEENLPVPVLDQTGLKGSYDIDLDWGGPIWPADGSRKITKASQEKLRQAVLDQLGLELIPTNLPTEMFVVEKVR